MTTNQPTSTNGNNETAQFLAPQAPTTAGMTTTGDYFAQPYADEPGFWFSDLEEFTERMARLTDRWGQRIEEVELQAVDLNSADTELFNALNITPASLETWFESVVDLDDREKAALFFLVTNNGYDLTSALDKYDDVCLSEGTLLDAATELFDECYLCDIPEKSPLRTYVDYEAFARDCRCGGDMVEFEFDGTYTCTNANNL